MALNKGNALAAFLVFLPLVGFADSKPVVSQHRTMLVPTNMRVLWDDSAIIARVRIITSTPRGIGDDPRFAPLVYTEHTARVLKTYRGRAAQEVRFLEGAGSLDLPDRIIQVEGRPTPLPAGSEYIVFLRAGPHGRYYLSFDREGAFKIEKGVVTAQGNGAYAHANRTVSEKRFLNELEYVSRGLRFRGAVVRRSVYDVFFTTR